jgi:alcohol dehydrogenase
LLATFVTQISRQAGLPGTLRERDVPLNAVPKLAAAATEQWTGTFNPVPLTSQDFESLYAAAH